MTYMACCKVCCGCKECAEGEEGKCCCGNECCAASTYCCNAECVSACSQGQVGDCKCATECCTNSEYCCDGACVGACGEGGAGPCKCGSNCCEAGEYCCDGECQAEPCVDCDTEFVCECPCTQSSCVNAVGCKWVKIIWQITDETYCSSAQAQSDCEAVGGSFTGPGGGATCTCDGPILAFKCPGLGDSPPIDVESLCDYSYPSLSGWSASTSYGSATCCDGVCYYGDCPP